MELLKTLTNRAKIRFHDCDPFNHLNNASYINYFMNHREDELLDKYNIDIYKMAQQTGVSWVSNSNQIAYLKPAFLMEEIIIESQLIAFNTSNLKVEMRMYNKDKSHLKALIWCGFTHFNLSTQQKDFHTEDLMSLFTSILNPIDQTNFEQRIRDLRSDIPNSTIKKRA